MVVQHNLQAMNANRMLGITQNAQSKSSEKLSSGYQINRAADDAAGLAISEKMRKQMKGLDRASTNAQDGVSAVQTAEGALTEVHSMLQRMNELAVQAANGTNSKEDRDAIQAEMDQLTTEIDRVAETTKFNETYLLKGNNATKTVNVNAHDAGLKGTLVQGAGSQATFTTTVEVGGSVSIAGADYRLYEDGVNDLDTVQAAVATGSFSADEKVVIDGTTYTWSDDALNASGGFVDTLGNEYSQETLSDLVGDGSSVTINDDPTLNVVKMTADDAVNITDVKAKMQSALTDASSVGGTVLAQIEDADITDTAITDNAGKTTAYDLEFKIHKATVDVQKDLTFSLHVGADADMTNKINVNISAMDSSNLGIKGLNVSDNTGTAATYAIDAIADAINKVSTQRSALGAVQNRLEHTIDNLDNVVENTTAAESRIRDTDMAEEMVEYSKNNILAQAGQSMLAQANTATQGVLSLLG
ncbi:MAG: flagellar hook protein [Agathobacter sp.]|nr:flagellar hook protein [Agathobacter sp.]MBQ3558746.1 flagellar hook protein [Agathobacter sp.]